MKIGKKFRMVWNHRRRNYASMMNNNNNNNSSNSNRDISLQVGNNSDSDVKGSAGSAINNSDNNNYTLGYDYESGRSNENSRNKAASCVNNNVSNEDWDKLTSKLIRCVSQKPVLYDLSCPMYKDHQTRNNAWKDIGRELNLSVTECQVKWSTLRRCLANARKRQMRRKAKGSNNKVIKKWRYQDEMSFLSPFLDLKDIEPINSEENGKISNNGGTASSFFMDNIMTNHHQSVIGRDAEQHCSEEESTSYNPTTAGRVPIYLTAEYDHPFYHHSTSRSTAAQANENNSSIGQDDDALLIDVKPNLQNLPNHGEHDRLYSPTTDLQQYEPEEIGIQPDLIIPPFSPCSESVIDAMQEPTDSTGYGKSQSVVYNSLDDMETFFLSMAKTVKKLPKLDQLKLKSQVFNMVYNAELKLILQSHSTSPTPQLLNNMNHDDEQSLSSESHQS